MSTPPTEFLRDVLQPLDRWDLDSALLTNRRFTQVVVEGMADVCLRQISNASFWAPTYDSEGKLAIYAGPGREIHKTLYCHEDPVLLFSEFMFALRSSRVHCLGIERLVLSPALASHAIRKPIFAEQVRLSASCTELTPMQFRALVLHFAPTTLDITSCRLRASQVSDGLLRSLLELDPQHTLFPKATAIGGDSYAITNDTVVEFFVQESKHHAPTGVARGQRQIAELVVNHASTTKTLFSRLVEAHSASVGTRPVRLSVSPINLEADDLREFSRHLTYRYRGTPYEHNIYDFPANHRFNIWSTSMHLQIVLFPRSKELIATRDRFNIAYFYKSDE